MTAEAVAAAAYTAIAAAAPIPFIAQAFNPSIKRKGGLPNLLPSGKRPRLEGPKPSTNPVVGTGNISNSSGMAFRTRGRRFGRGRRRFKRRTRGRRRFRRKGFARAVKRVLLRTAENKKIDNVTAASQTLANGDGISRIIYICNPPSELRQGIQADQFIGGKVWLKGISLRGQVATSQASDLTQGFLVRITLIKSKYNAAGMGTTFVTFGNTTTATTNPAQTAPFANPRIFESTGTLGFTGLGWVYPFDRTGVRVIKSFTLAVSPGGNGGTGVTNIPTPFKLWFPINRMHTFQDPLEGDLSTVDVGGKWGSYYLVVQAVSDTNNISATVIGEMDYRITTYYRDV